MKERLGEMWDSIRYFCASHAVDFYIGMALTVLVLLNLSAFLPIWLAPSLCPIAVPLLYLLIRALSENPMTWKGSIPLRRGLLASELGCAWALALTLI